MARSRIAVICLGYLGNPIGVRHLAEYCGRAEAALYVHIDAKVDIEPYRDALAPYAHARLLQRRVTIYWGGYTLVDAVIGALDLTRGRYDRFCLVTEDSVPLVSPEVFRDMMAEPCEYIWYTPQSAPHIVQRYQGYYFLDCAACNPRTVPAEARHMDDATLTGLRRLHTLRHRGKRAVPLLYHGPTYWALSAGAIDEILNRHHGDAHLRASFEFSYIPEEQYFHTILGASAAGYRIRPFMHADFSRPPSVPYVYDTLDELRALRNLPYLFARKAMMDGSGIEPFYAELHA